jgi:uncharacterized protein (TIGR00251 family)
MASSKMNLHGGKMGSALAIRVTPRARKNEISEILSDGTIKIRLTAPPVEGKANEALVDFLSEILDTSSSNIEIIAGASSRNKLVSVLNMDSETTNEKILAQLK